eukprot:gene3296-3750_t
MTNKLIYTLLALSITFGAYAQKSDGTTRSLVNAEREFAEHAVKDGEKTAFLNYSADNALVFRPNPINAKTFYSGQQDHKNLSWSPVYTRVSKSGDWGFTTGTYVLNGEEKSYGDYLSVWKVVNDRWQLALDLGTSHNKPLKKGKEEFIEPGSFYKPKFINSKQIAAGVGIILTTEKTLNVTLKSYGSAAFSGFLNPDARLLFPGQEPIVGKDRILTYFNGMVQKISLKTTSADKALGGDFAYTYGVATIDYKADLRESFNYVFIYERQADHNWNIIAQIFTPAER